MHLRNIAICVAVALCLSRSPTAWAQDVTKSGCADASEEAQQHRVANHVKEAAADLIRCTQPTCPSIIKQFCEQMLREVRAQLPSIVLVARDARGNDVLDARVALDGAWLPDLRRGTAVDLDPGEQVVRFEHPGSAPVEMHIVAHEGEKDRVILATFADNPPAPATSAAPATSVAPATPLEPAAPKAEAPKRAMAAGLPTVGYAVGALGLLGAGVFAYLAVSGQATADGCASHGCSQDTLHGLDGKRVATWSVGAVSALALGVGAWLLVSASSARAPGVALGIRLDGPGASLVGVY
jgi:hypothetical protein